MLQRQVGVGMPVGCEVAAQAARHDMKEGSILGILEFFSAFNRLLRGCTLSLTFAILPELAHNLSVS